MGLATDTQSVWVVISCNAGYETMIHGVFLNKTKAEEYPLDSEMTEGYHAV